MTHNLKSKSPQAAFPVDPLSVLETSQETSSLCGILRSETGNQVTILGSREDSYINTSFHEKKTLTKTAMRPVFTGDAWHLVSWQQVLWLRTGLN